MHLHYNLHLHVPRQIGWMLPFNEEFLFVLLNNTHLMGFYLLEMIRNRSQQQEESSKIVLYN